MAWERSASARQGALVLAFVVVAVATLLVTYLALGGGAYKPLEVADPCSPRPLPPAEGSQETSQQILLSALDGAACRLQVTREELTLALASPGARERFAREHGIRGEVLEEAVRSGLERAVLDAERAGRLSGPSAALLRSAVGALPIGTLLDGLGTGRGLIGGIGDLLDR